MAAGMIHTTFLLISVRKKRYIWLLSMMSMTEARSSKVTGQKPAPAIRMMKE